MSKPVISCSKNGPMIVKGLENFIDSDGTRLTTKAAMGLCRCGASKNNRFAMAAIKTPALAMKSHPTERQTS